MHNVIFYILKASALYEGIYPTVDNYRAYIIKTEIAKIRYKIA